MNLWDRLWTSFFRAVVTDKLPVPHYEGAVGDGAVYPAVVTEYRDEDGKLIDRAEQKL